MANPPDTRNRYRHLEKKRTILVFFCFSYFFNTAQWACILDESQQFLMRKASLPMIKLEKIEVEGSSNEGFFQLNCMGHGTHWCNIDRYESKAMAEIATLLVWLQEIKLSMNDYLLIVKDGRNGHSSPNVNDVMVPATNPDIQYPHVPKCRIHHDIHYRISGKCAHTSFLRILPFIRRFHSLGIEDRGTGISPARCLLFKSTFGFQGLFWRGIHIWMSTP